MIKMILTLGVLLAGAVVFFSETPRNEASIDVDTEDNEDDLGGVTSPPSRVASNKVDFL